MPWKAILRVALMLGLDKWAERKAADLIQKGLDKLHKKAEAVAATVPASAALPAIVAEVAAAQQAVARVR
jgi:hypothetical protein